ncbi:CNH domain-containing protein, partial [Cerioporus squamosus]
RHSIVSPADLHLVLPYKRVTQCSVVEELGVLLILANNWLVLYRMDPLFLSAQQKIPDAWPVELLSDVHSFRVGTLDGHIVAVCLMRGNLPRTVLFRLASLTALWEPNSFPVVGEFELPFAAAADAVFLRDQIVIMSATEFDFAVIDTGLTHVSRRKLDIPLSLVKDCEGCVPLGAFSPSSDELLLCYSGFGLYMTWYGHPSCPNYKIEWEGQAKSVACHAPYILLFGVHHIEIRHMSTGHLVQIIPGDDVQCLFDGRSVAGQLHSELPEGAQGRHEASDLWLQGLSGAPSGRPCVFELRPKTVL